MALIQVEMNQVNGGGTSDVIVPNAIANNDGTSSGFSQDANNVLGISGTSEIISKKKLVWTNTTSTSFTCTTTGVSQITGSLGDSTLANYINQHLDSTYAVNIHVKNDNNTIYGHLITQKRYSCENVNFLNPLQVPSQMSVEVVCVFTLSGAIFIEGYMYDISIELSEGGSAIYVEINSSQNFIGSAGSSFELTIDSIYEIIE